MTREMKVGMAVIGVLLTAFSGVLYKRLHKSDDLPAATTERPAAAGAKPPKTPAAKPSRSVAKLPSELEADSAGRGKSNGNGATSDKPSTASSTAGRSSNDPFSRASVSTNSSKPLARYGTSAGSRRDATTESESSEDSSEMDETEPPTSRRRYAISDRADDDAEAEDPSDDDIPMADDRYSETLDETDDEAPPSYRDRYRMAADDSEEEAAEDTSSSEEFDPTAGSYDDSEDEVAAADDPAANMDFPARPARDAAAARTSFQDRMNRGKPVNEPLPRSLDSADSEESAAESGEPYSPGPDERRVAPVPLAAVPSTTAPRAIIRRSPARTIETDVDVGETDAAMESESIATPRIGARGGNTYVVTAGESLFDIARQELGAASQWTELYNLNRDRLGGDLESLPDGLELELPTRQARTPRTNSAGRLRLR